MGTIDLQKLYEESVKIVQEIGDFVLTQQNEAEITMKKRSFDYATNIDYLSEQKFKEKLAKLDKQIGFFSEEENKKPESELYWVVDPIEGTKNYYRKLSQWCLNLALFNSSRQETLLSVVYFPKLKELFSAIKGKGAYLNGEKIQPSEISSLNEAYIYLELPDSSSISKYSKVLSNIIKSIYKARSWGIASGLCYVASGAFDAYIDLSGTTKPFDILAPLLIAKESGCKIISNYKDKENITIVTNNKLVIKL